jgi:hypothetical protein
MMKALKVRGVSTEIDQTTVEEVLEARRSETCGNDCETPVRNGRGPAKSPISPTALSATAAKISNWA